MEEIIEQLNDTLTKEGLQQIIFEDFNEKLKKEGLRALSFEDYLTLEMVYMFHPLIKGIEQIINLYKIGGMQLINDMAQRARKIFLLREEFEAERENTTKKMIIADKINFLLTK